MAGDWIKMRCNLWDDPRVSGLCDATGEKEAAIVGGLYRLWVIADQHSEHGTLTGLTVKGVDRKTGIKGMGEALVSIGWLVDTPDGVQIARFDEHNGESAKVRAQTARRVSKHKANAQVTQEVTQSPLPKKQESNAVTVTPALPREENRREDIEEPLEELSQVQTKVDPPSGDGASPVSRSVEIAVYLRQRGIVGANSVNPSISAWSDDARVTNEILDAALSIVASRKLERQPGPNYLAPIIADLLAPKPAAPPRPREDHTWKRSDAGIARKAAELGIVAPAGKSFDWLREKCEAELSARAQRSAA